MLIHAYRLVYPDGSPGPAMLWEWEEPHVDRLLWNAKTFGREVEQCDFSDWEALAQENQRIWDMHYRHRPLYQLWDTWRAWLAEYREIVRDMQEVYEEQNGRMLEERSRARQNGQYG